MALGPGTTLGSYEILAPLGVGGMGEVYRARDARLSRDVAIKVLPEAFATDPDRLTRFRREAQTLASLNHPNIAAIYGLDEADGTPYLVLEMVTGETLAARLARGPLPTREALAIGIQVAAAIEAAHEGGVIHRDLKPGNVMITPSGVAKVLDFGLAKSLAPTGFDSSASAAVTAEAGATLAGSILGTAAYMSPEQARGKAVDRRGDVWSFGCLLFECFAGRPAFGGDTVPDVLARILERDPDWAGLPAGTPARVRELLRRCLRKDADTRLRDIRDVRIELAAAAAGDSDGARSAEKSIAVLPFENLSGSDDEYFADGITDEILNSLAHVEGLRVAARTSCFAFKGRREDLRVVGEKLEATTVLEGSVRRAGARLRITAQLVNAADGYQLWSERYDREMADVFQVQEEIANAIANRLRGTLHDEAYRVRARTATKNLEAFELVLKGRALQNRRGRFLADANACFERAIALDPGYSEALACLSDSYRLMGVFGVAPFAEVFAKARSTAERALAIDPSLAEAWLTLASVEHQYEGNCVRGQELWEHTLALDPRLARARAQRALWSFCTGEWDAERAVSDMRRAVHDDPLNSWIIAMHSHLLDMVGRSDEAIAEAERSVTVDPDSFFAHWCVMRAHASAGHYERAIELAPPLARMSGRHHWMLAVLGWSYGKAGQRDHARAVYDELEGRSRHEFVGPFWIAAAAGAAGLVEEGLRLTERSVRERDPIVAWARTTTYWDSLQSDPRFDRILRRT